MPNWFCHFDDDTFVNFEKLKSTLKSFNHLQDHYIGKRSISEEGLSIFYKKDGKKIKSKKFTFGTGGAGWCISKAIIPKFLNQIE